MAASAAATRSRSFARSTSSRAALYCGSHSGNLKASFIIVSPLASGQVPLLSGSNASAGSPSETIGVTQENVEQGIPMVGLYLVAHEPSPMVGAAGGV